MGGGGSGDDVIQQAVHNRDSKKFNAIIGGVVVTTLLFFFPVGLFYMFIFYKTNLAFIDGVYLFATIYLVGATACLMYYRFVVVGDDKIQIEKMDLGTVSAVFQKSFAAFFGILGVTLVAISLNPSMVRIFENTIGFTVCKWWGVNDTLKEMLKSDLFDKVSNGMSQEDRDQYMNYDFLITMWNQEDKKQLEEDIILTCSKKNSNGEETRKRNLQFDFYWNADTITKENMNQLLSFIDLKYYVGHFTWVYIGATFSLLTSLVTTLM
jgi:hypothetical protein